MSRKTYINIYPITIQQFFYSSYIAFWCCIMKRGASIGIFNIDIPFAFIHKKWIRDSSSEETCKKRKHFSIKFLSYYYQSQHTIVKIDEYVSI